MPPSELLPLPGAGCGVGGWLCGMCPLRCWRRLPGLGWVPHTGPSVICAVRSVCRPRGPCSSVLSVLCLLDAGLLSGAREAL